MAYMLNLRALQTALSGGTWHGPAGAAAFEVVVIGALLVTSGRVVACDPFLGTREPFVQKVPRGAHPVGVVIARQDGEERIAFAQLTFAPGTPDRWEMALTGEESTASLRADEYFGYPADRGTGCFMDEVAGGWLEARMLRDDFSDVLEAELRRTYKPRRVWLDFRPLHEHRENVICFSSGSGDGKYPSFFGFGEDGRVLCLVTDFMLLDET